MNALSSFIRGEMDNLIADWAALAIARLPPATTQPALNLIDHLPEILLRLADAIDANDPSLIERGDAPRLHATRRLQAGFGIRDVIAEYQLLRKVIMETFLARQEVEQHPGKEFLVFIDALENAVADALDVYITSASERHDSGAARAKQPPA
jgi:hypothetical protein